MQLKIDVSPGELIDKLTILEIKLDRIADAEKRRNVAHEYDVLTAVLNGIDQSAIMALRAELRQVNAILWDVMGDMKDYEAAGDFGADFVRTARAILHTNDRRSDLKREINLLLRSDLLEEKSYGGQ